MPSGASHDLGLLAPIDEKSWIFDLDGFSDHLVPLPFDPEATTKLVYELATRINTVFYWAANQKLVDTFGGKEA